MKSPAESSRADQAFLARLAQLSGARCDEDALALVLQHFRAASGTLHRLRDGVLQLSAHSPGIPPQVLEVIRVVPIGKGMAGLAAERRAPVTACNLQTDQSGDVRPGARATGLKGSLVVPLLADGELHGTLGIGNLEEREFTPAETELLLAAGGVLARVG
ncbi:MAG: GAF domain-containing protein [Planctomycetota bacterium]